MKKLYILPAAALLCACATGNKCTMNQVKEEVWTQDPINMCASLIEQNKSALQTIKAKYGQAVANEIAPLYQELDLQSNAVCRSRIVQQAQVERLKELRAEYLEKINVILNQEKAK
ncbi:hypothetical protein [Candidatus Avelusimicrobium sp.]